MLLHYVSRLHNSHTSTITNAEMTWDMDAVRMPEVNLLKDASTDRLFSDTNVMLSVAIMRGRITTTRQASVSSMACPVKRSRAKSSKMKSSSWWPKPLQSTTNQTHQTKLTTIKYHNLLLWWCWAIAASSLQKVCSKKLQKFLLENLTQSKLWWLSKTDKNDTAILLSQHRCHTHWTYSNQSTQTQCRIKQQ